MGKARLTSVGISVSLNDNGLELRIYEDDDGAFKAIPRPDHMATWRKLVAMYGEVNVSPEKISLDAADIFAAEAELRKLLSSKDELTLSASTLFRYTKDNVRFTLHTNQKQPVELKITSAPERMNDSNPRANAYLIALKSSPKCRSAEMLSNGIKVFLAPRYCSGKNRLATYPYLVDLY